MSVMKYKNYTFIFLFYNIKDDSLQHNFNDSIIANLLQANFNEEINILIVDTRFFNLAGTTQRTFESVLFELKPDEAKANWQKGDDQIEANFGNINIADKDVLGLILMYIKLKYPAYEYVLYTNNHSNQFGALDYDARVFDKNNSKYIEFIKPTPIIKHIYEPNENVDMLSYYELSKAIEKGFLLNQFAFEKDKDYCLGLLINIGCYSATLDNLYHFSKSSDERKSLVRYYCGCESRIANYFIDAKEIVNQITQNGIKKGIQQIFELLPVVYSADKRSLATMFSCFEFTDLKTVKFFFTLLRKFIDHITTDSEISKTLQGIYKQEKDVSNIRFFKEEGDDLIYKYSIDFFEFLLFFEDKLPLIDIAFLKDRYKEIVVFMNCTTFSGISCFVPPADLRTIALDGAKETAFAMDNAYLNKQSKTNEFNQIANWQALISKILSIP